MDGTTPSVSPAELYARLGTAAAPVLVDVRRSDAFSKDSGLIVGAFHRPPEDVERWSEDIPGGRPVVAYCVHGHEVSQGAAASLRRAGIKAAYLEGGMAAWKEAGLATRKKLGAIENKWVTREHPKIDRIACPWLISRLINPLAEFLYVPAKRCHRRRQTGRRDPIRHQGSRLRPCRRSLLLRRHHPDFRDQRSSARPSRGHCSRRRHVSAGSHAAMRRPAGDLLRPLRQLSRRPRDARAWGYHLRRALHMVSHAADITTISQAPWGGQRRRRPQWQPILNDATSCAPD